MLLCTEEDKQAAKANRMKQHLGLTKTKAQSQAHNVSLPDNDECDLPAPVKNQPPEMMQIQKQIADLQAQIATLLYFKEGKSDSNKAAKKKVKPKRELPAERQTPATPASTAKRPKPWYCFRCGEDGHIVSGCSNPPNPTLVEAKRKELKEKQQARDKINSSSDTLN